MERLKVIYFCTALFYLLSSGFVESFHFWNPTQFNVAPPDLLEIDSERNLLIVAAKNSICQLSFDLQSQFNVQDTGPAPGIRQGCLDDLNQEVDCENYPYVLTIPQSSGSVTSANGTQHSFEDTVLVCSSNLFDPICSYRHRESLEHIRTVDGNSFCPYNHHTGVASMWSSYGQLVSATPLDQWEQQFGISVSHAPFNGQVDVQSLPRNQFWFHNSPTFVSMYEVGDYFYVFFQEEALESPEKVIYSRVARVCKDDFGSSNLVEDIDKHIFTTFVKARISCSSGNENGNDIKFHYNELQDTFVVRNGSQEQLYAVFTSARNGPTGSAMCVFTFGQEENDIGNVFNGAYLRLVSNQWITVNNYPPFTCEPNSRSLDHARNIQLMKNTVQSSNGPRPLYISDDLSFDKVIVTRTTALDQQSYDVIFIAAHSAEELVIVKAFLTQDQQYHVIYTEGLGPATRVSQMKVSEGEERNVYIATDAGVYGISVANCSMYSDCCSCVAARDPFCAFDTSLGQCVAVSSQSNVNLVQNVSTGTSDHCTCEKDITNEPTTSDKSTPTVGCGKETAPSIVVTPSIVSSVVGGLNVRNSTQFAHTWTVVGAVTGFVGGIFVGMLVTAFFFRKANIFLHSKRERRRRRDLEEHGNERKSLSNKSGRSHNNLQLHVTSSNGKQEKNNNIRLNDYTPMATRKAALDPSTKFSSTYPPLYCDVPDSCSVSPVAVTPPTKPPTKIFTFDAKPPPSPPQYSTLQPKARTDPNVKASQRTQEHISNQERAAYGRNILARAPSVDPTKHAKYSKTTLPVVSPHLRFGTYPNGSVDVPDAVTGYSHC